jgi:hypothetical protein
MMKKQTEIDETYEYKHMCQCTEDINDVATACNTNNVVHGRIAEIAKPTIENEVKSDRIYFPTSELTTEPIDSKHSSQTGANCYYPITWFLGSHCGDRKSVATLVWVLIAILIGQTFVILSMLSFIIIGFRMHEPKIVCFEQVLDSQGIGLPNLNKALHDNNCEKDVENIYSEPVNTTENINGYLTMRSPLNYQYEEPINFKPSYTNNKLMENSSTSSNPI